jgi:general secretion pathway protein K
MKDQHKNNKGFALLVVILVLLLASFMASRLVMQVRTELQIASNYHQRTIGRLLAEGGVNLAIFRLIGEVGEEYEELLDGARFLHGRSYETVLPTGKIKYYAVNESGKINLNGTSFGLLERFLEFHGLETEEVKIIIDSLQDWRDGNDLYRLNGAERDYYEGLDKPYTPRDGNLGDPCEFFLIRGTETLRGKFDPYEVFTVSGNSKKVNFNSLTPAMLSFLVDGDEGKISLYREELELAKGRISVAKMQEIMGVERYAPMRNYLSNNVVGRNRFFSISADGYAGEFSEDSESVDESELDIAEEVIAPSRPGMRVRVLIEQISGGFRYLSWKEQRL